MNYHTDEIKRLIRKAYLSAKSAGDILANTEIDDKSNAIIYLNQSRTYIYTAKSIFIASSEIADRYSIGEAFRYFDTFDNELVDAIATKHSIQHAYTYYLDFEKAVDDVPEY